MNHLLIGRKLFDKTMAFIGKSLDVRASRHQVISGNVANVETPGYDSKDLPFQKVLENYLGPESVIPLKRTHAMHLPPPEAQRDYTAGVETDPAGGVNIDEQMAKLAENNLNFQAGVQALIKKFEGLKVAMSDTR